MSQDVLVAGEGAGVIVAFNYATLDMETRITVQGNTRAIKERMARTAQDIADIGGYLADTRARLEHGQFLAWLAAEFDMSERTAYNYIAVNERFKSANFAEMSVATSALYLLAAPSTPEAAREEAIQRAAAGETITHQKAQQIVSEHKPAARPRGGGDSGGGGGTQARGGGGGSGGGGTQARGGGGGSGTQTRPTAPASPPPPLFPLPSAPSSLLTPLTPLTPLVSEAPVVLTPLADPEPAVAAPAVSVSDADEIAVLSADEEESVIAAAAQPSLAGAVAQSAQEQQLRLLSAMDLLLTEVQQGVRAQLDDLRGQGAPAYTVGTELIRQSARQLEWDPALRADCSTLALSLREGEPPTSLAQLLRDVRELELAQAPTPVALQAAEEALQELSSSLADATYEQLAVRLSALRVSQVPRAEPAEGPDLVVLQAIADAIGAWWDNLDGTDQDELDAQVEALRFVRGQARRLPDSGSLVEAVDELIAQIDGAEPGVEDEE